MDQGVDFVIVGGVAGTLAGSPHVTNDLDIVYATERRLVGRARAESSTRRINRGARANQRGGLAADYLVDQAVA